MDKTPKPDALESTSLGEEAAIGRIQKALFGGDDRLVTLGRYEIRELIGSGAFGKVYRARDPELDRDVALKVLSAETNGDRATLLREARTMASLGHPNVVAVHDAGVIDDAGRVRVFIAMELVEGANLRTWLEQVRSPAAILELMRQVGRGLAAAHAAGIVHRDLKPDNILVGNDGRARVVDFGLARAHAGGAVPGDAPVDRASVAGAIVGTPAYMAPELLAAEPADAKSDQFAFCVTAWEALYGQRPFEGTTIAELRAAMATSPLRLARFKRGTATVPAGIHHALVRGLSIAPGDRFPSMDALVVALEPRRSRAIIAVALLATAAAGISIGVAMRSSHPAENPCPDPTAELTGVWDVARKDETRAAFARSSLPFQAETFTRVAAQLDRISTGWLGAHRDACLATAVRHDQSADLLDRRMSCLRRFRRQLAAVTATLAAPTDEVIQHAVATVAELPPLSACADREALAAGPAMPPEPAVRARIDALFDQLARAHDSATVDDLARDPLATSHPPLAIAIALWRAEAATTAGRHDEARTSARTAFDLALTNDDRRSEIRAATALVTLGAFDTRRKDDALQWARTGTAVVAKLDAPEDLDAKLALAEGGVQIASADAVAAETAFTRAVADYRRLGADHPGLGAALARLGTSELGRGRLEDAAAHLTESVERSAAALGPSHPELAAPNLSLALVEGGRGHYVDAIARIDAAVDLLKRTYGPDHLMLIYAYGSRAYQQQFHGDPAAAERDYREAARIALLHYGAEHPMVSQLALARADLLARRGDGAEAVELATRAREIVASTADARDLGVAYADAILARALAVTGKRDAAIEHARAGVARCDAFTAGLPSGPCAIVHQALGEVARDPRELEAAAAAIIHGTPDPGRLAEIRLSLARLTGDPAVAALGFREFPRDGDPMIRAGLEAIVR